MKVGILAPDLTFKHGWGNYSLSIIHALQSRGIELQILTARNSQGVDGLTIHPVLPAIAPQERFTLAKMFLWRNRVASLLADCDVIHSMIEIYAPLLRFIARNRPTFMTAHGSYIHLPEIRQFPANHIIHDAFARTHIICVSHYTGSIAGKVIPEARTSVILNAINAGHFADIVHESSDKPVVVSSGGVKARKGTLELVRAIAKVRDTLPDIECHIIGSLKTEPAYVDRVKAEIQQLNLDDTVFLEGFVSDEALQHWYAGADVFALPSMNDGWKFEGFGLATMEASAAGIAVIGTRGCGAEDAIDHEETGLLVSQDRIDEELPLAILELLTHRDKARKMGEAGRQKALSYTWDDVADQLISLYESELNR